MHLRSLSMWLAALGCVVLAGCGTLPDARPFADASGTLSRSVGAAGRAITDSMAEAGSVVPGDEPAYRKLARDFDGAWQLRQVAVQGAANYAEAIAGLVAAGSQGAETAGKVADSLQSLATAAGVPMAAPVVEVASDLARFLFERIAIVRASGQLESAVARAQPAVDRLALHIVGESEQQLKPILLNVYKNIASGVKSDHDDDTSFAEQLKRKRDAARADVLKDAAALPRLQEIDRALATVAIRLQERDRRLDQAATAYKARLQLVNALSIATLAWAQAHRDLADAIVQKRRVDVAELMRTVGELQALSKKVSEL